MCGIVGYLDMRGERKLDMSLLVRMADKLIHRGPDACGYFVEGGVGLGFRRLSIIDLNNGGQPQYNEDESIVLICNGEIYNHVELKRELMQKGHCFRTQSDVEVLLHLFEEHGVEFLNKLNGQFAFALYDRKERKLILARDQFGINPLYYTFIDDVFIFGSEIKSILEHPMVSREMDLTALDQIMSFPGLVSPKTMFRGIESLNSGHYLEIKDSNVRIVEYWDLDYPKIDEADYDRPESYYIETLADILIRSVKYRLQADVPVGFYLSGGLDSSLIGALIEKVSPGIKRHSFSISFTDEEISEAKYQQLLTERINSAHHDILFDWQQIADRLYRMIYHCECPVKETFNTCAMALSQAAHDSRVKVVLTGQGADELFAGYPGYRFDQFGIRKSERYDLDHILEAEIRERLWGDPNLFYEIDQYELRQIKTALYSPAVSEVFRSFDCLNYHLINKRRLQGRHPLHQRSYLDFKLRLAEHLLIEHGDKMSMANSIEGRHPFLDIRLVEFVKGMPPDLKLNGFVEKYILKKIAEPLIPQQIINREKFGFRSPGAPYLLQRGVEWVEDLLSYESVRRQGYFNPDVVETLKLQYSQEGFRLNPHLEIDLLMVVLTVSILTDLFNLPHLV